MRARDYLNRGFTRATCRVGGGQESRGKGPRNVGSINKGLRSGGEMQRHASEVLNLDDEELLLVLNERVQSKRS